MAFTTIRARIDMARALYRSEGVLVLLYILIGYLWKECVWLFVRLLSRGETIERTVCGHRMHLNLHDTGIAKELAVYRVQEPVATALLQKEIEPGMRVVDIGANIGYYTLLLARLVGEAGKVIAIEPVPDNANLLRINLEANGYQNVLIYEAAAGAESGTMKLYLSNKWEWASFVHRDLPDKHIDVPVHTLDTLLDAEGRIDYIKMDIEGYETEAIKGMLGILRRYRPGMFVEIHPSYVEEEAMTQFLEDIQELGYEIKYMVNRLSDHPVVRRKHAAETTNIDTLKADPRVTQIKTPLMLFLEAVRDPAS